MRGLAPASAYGFQVRAVNSAGTGGAASATLAVTTGSLSWTVATDETGYAEGDDIAVTVSAATSYGGNCPSGFPLSLALEVSDPDEVLSDAATRTLNFSACQASKTVSFATVDDSVEEAAAAVTFTLAVAPTDTTPHLSATLGATPPSAQVTVADNDGAGPQCEQPADGRSDHRRHGAGGRDADREHLGDHGGDQRREPAHGRAFAIAKLGMEAQSREAAARHGPCLQIAFRMGAADGAAAAPQAAGRLGGVVAGARVRRRRSRQREECPRLVERRAQRRRS